MEALEVQVDTQESQLYSSRNTDSQRSVEILERTHSPRTPRTAGTRDQPIMIQDETSEGPSQEESSQENGDRRKRDFDTYAHDSQGSDSQSSVPVSWARVEAYNAMMRNVLGSGEGGWEGISLISTGQGHSNVEPELGG